MATCGLVRLDQEQLHAARVCPGQHGVAVELRAIVEQMKIDEAQHAQTAIDHGGAPLPPPVKWAMRFAADVMRQTASRI